MDLRNLNKEEIDALKDKIVRLFDEGFSVGLVLTLAGISRDQLKRLRRDQMFDHHIIQAIHKAEKRDKDGQRQPRE